MSSYPITRQVIMVALTADQQKAMDEVKKTVTDVKTSVTEVKTLVQESLSIQNVGGGHIFNVNTRLEATLAKLADQIKAVENA